MTAVAGSVFTSAQFNTFIRDNLAETAPAKATTPGSYFVTSATNQIAERHVVATTGLTSSTTTSTSYTDLDEGPGPSLTVTTGSYALVVLSAALQNTTTSSSRMAYEITGASSIAPVDNRGLATYGSANGGMVGGITVYHDDLTAGVNTFVAKYRVAGGTGTFFSRRMFVIPL